MNQPLASVLKPEQCLELNQPAVNLTARTIKKRVQQEKIVRENVNGVLLLNKPIGMSSNAALQIAKRTLRAKKAGHTGTLDPFASGLLPLCLGEATKFAQDLLEADKRYIATVHFGVQTDTADIEGVVIARNETKVTQAQVQAALPHFCGAQQQVPPMYSALKRDGKPLYEYARAGIELERSARAITIHRLVLLSFEWPQATLDVQCSKGTYIRVLAEDIAKHLGTCGHLAQLVRTEVGRFQLAQAHSLSALEELGATTLLPVDTLAINLPACTLSEKETQKFLNGLNLPWSDIATNHQAQRVYAGEIKPENFLGVAQIVDGYLMPKRLVNTTAYQGD